MCDTPETLGKGGRDLTAVRNLTCGRWLRHTLSPHKGFTLTSVPRLLITPSLFSIGEPTHLRYTGSV
jgi:hypothetical protein